MNTFLMRGFPLFALFTLLTAGVTNYVAHNAAARQTMPCRAFAETGKTLCNTFLLYWEQHGGLAQQGYPISGEFKEQSEMDGKSYTVQYFERAIFELHAENKPPYNVLLSLLGSLQYNQKYPASAPVQRGNTAPGSLLFPQTGKRLGGVFLTYWHTHGGVAQQGYPISDEFTEKSDTDGKSYTVQYFERAVFERHTENTPPYDVLLSLLGTQRFEARYQGRQPGTAVPVTPSPTPAGDPYGALRARPLKLPVVAPGRPCPATTGREVSPSFSPALGNGPVYPVGLGTDGVLDLTGATEEGGWILSKVLWIAAPTFRGPALIRGRQLDGLNELRFEQGPNPPNELKLHTNDRPPDTSGWTDWPTYTRLRGPGCYAYQVDAPGFTLIIPFQVR